MFLAPAVMLVILFAVISVPYVVCGKKAEGEVVSSAKVAEAEKEEPEEKPKEVPDESDEKEDETD